MTQTKYTIAHLNVGAENYWEEVEGFISANGDRLSFLTEKVLSEFEALNSEPVYVEKILKLTPNEAQEEKFRIINNSFVYKNDFKLPLKIQEKYRITPYGGYDTENENNFYLLLPTYSDTVYSFDDSSFQQKLFFKSGDVFSSGHYGKMLISCNEMNAWHSVVINALNPEENKSRILIYPSLMFYPRRPIIENCNFWKSSFLKYEGNIFREYARTGILENELYKQFFK